jgi:6-phosphogluconolactonase (cycloisomerase 2 family)
VSGLSGSGLALSNNGSSNISVTGNGVVTIANGVSANTAYQVAVATQPTSPSQKCSVANGSGTVSSNVSNITVSCVTNSYTVGGNVSNLLGSGLVISNNGSANLPVTGVTYAYALASGSPFSFTFVTQPSNPSQTCAFANPPNASGTVGSSDNTSIDIVCTTNSYAVGGTVSGLTGTGLALSLNGGSSLPISANGTFSFPSAVLSGATYTVAVAAQPNGANYTCDVAGGTGTVQGGPITNVAVVCGPIVGFAYVANAAIASGSVAGLSSYAINGTTGALSPLSPSLVPTGNIPAAIALTPNKQFAYVTSNIADTVSGFVVNTATGALTAVPGGPVATGGSPLAAVVDPSGQFLYVANGSESSDSISAYSINQTTGALAPIAGSPFATGQGPESIAITPSGQFLYVGNNGSNSIWGYTLNGTTGALTPLSGNPFPTGTGVESVAIQPSGAFLYAAASGSNNGSPATGSVSAYAIDSGTGALTAVTGSPFTAGSNTNSVALNPAGTFLYASNYTDSTVSAYTINSSTGVLTVVPGSPFAAGTANAAYSVDVDPSGAFLYVTNGNVFAFSINPGSGALTEVPGAPFPAASQPHAVVTIP